MFRVLVVLSFNNIYNECCRYYAHKYTTNSLAFECVEYNDLLDIKLEQLNAYDMVIAADYFSSKVAENRNNHTGHKVLNILLTAKYPGYIGVPLASADSFDSNELGAEMCKKVIVLSEKFFENLSIIKRCVPIAS